MKPVIHRAENVGIPVFLRTFILYGSAPVVCFYPFVYFLEADAVAGFVAHAPYDHARVIQLAEHVPLVAFQVSLRQFLRLILERGQFHVVKWESRLRSSGDSLES